MRSIVLNFIEVGLLLTASFIGQPIARAQTTPQKSDEPVLTQQTQDSPDTKKNVILADRTLYGNHSLLEILTGPKFADVRKHVGVKPDDEKSILKEIQENPLEQKIAHKLKWRDYITDKGEFYRNHLSDKANDIARTTLKHMAAKGKSVGSALHNKSNSIEWIATGDPLTKFIKDNAFVPDAIEAHLKKVPLATVLEKDKENDGRINKEKLRDAILTPVKDQSLYYAGPKFIEATLGPEIAAASYMPLYHPDDSARIRAFKETTFGQFISNGSSAVFEKNRRATEYELYPPEMRALDAEQFRGRNGISNPWPQFMENDKTAAPKTIVPVKILSADDIKDGDFVTDPTISNPHPLTKEQEAYVLYTLPYSTLGTCAVLQEVKELPMKPGPMGVPVKSGIEVSVGDLSKVPLNGNPAELGPAGLSLHASNTEQHVRIGVFSMMSHQTPSRIKIWFRPRRTYK